MSSSEAVSSSGTPVSGLQWVNFPGYDEAGKYKISAAVVVPPGRRLVATSGHVGRDSAGNHPDDLEAEFVMAFDKVEKSLHAVDPTLSPEQLWGSVYQLTTYHAGGIKDPYVFKTLLAVGARYFREHRPAWTAVEVKELNMGVRFEIAVNAALP
ncbi:YjgF-like protein [Acephala macrosclerotiorum]|nr:YjgF-like protein [Acephala macrosclerotiorum]